MARRIVFSQVAPEGIKALAGTSAYLESASIEARMNGCPFCVDLHARQARQAGETQQRLDCLPVWQEAPFFDDRERAALAWAESITRVQETGVPDSVYDQARASFSEKELVDLTMIASLANAWNRLAISFRQSPVARAAD